MPKPNDTSTPDGPSEGDPPKTAPAEPPERVGLKDKLALGLAVLSLAISGTTFVLDRSEAHRSSVTAENRAGYNAFELGKRLALSFVVYHQVDRGAPADIEATRQEALDKAREAQPYADSLGVGFSIEQLIARFRPDSGVINESVIDAVADRIRAQHSETVVGKFRLGFSFFWLMFNVGVAQGNSELLALLRPGYPQVAQEINLQLTELGVRQRLPPTLENPRAVFRLAPRIRSEIEAILDAGPRS